MIDNQPTETADIRGELAILTKILKKFESNEYPFTQGFVECVANSVSALLDRQHRLGYNYIYIYLHLR